MNKYLNLIAFGFILFFSFWGMIYVSTFVHELSHKQDFSHYAIDGTICLMTYKSEDMGFYTFSYLDNETKQVNAISKYTEFKAYGIDTLVMLLFFGCIIILILKMAK
jgi:hypothetical protein